MIISNGFGEDQIGAKLGQALKTLNPDIFPQAISLVGDGHAYKQLEIPVSLSIPTPPSGGFIRDLKTMIKDLKSGSAFALINAYKKIRPIIKEAEIVISVGDVFCLFMCSNIPHMNRFFLPTAKSNRFMSHTIPEYMYIRKKAKKVYPRDQETMEAFKSKGISADFLGSPMFDLNVSDKPPFRFKNTGTIIAFLPGSKQEAYLNIEHMLTIMTHPQFPHRSCIISLAPSLSLATIETLLSNEHWTPLTPTRWTFKNLELIISIDFEQVIAHSHIVIGLAGTANEQAAYCGCDVYSYPGKGPQSTEKRLLEQSKLMNHIITYIPSSKPEDIISKISTTQTKKSTESTSLHNSAASAIIQDILAHTHSL